MTRYDSPWSFGQIRLYTPLSAYVTEASHRSFTATSWLR